MVTPLIVELRGGSPRISVSPAQRRIRGIRDELAPRSERFARLLNEDPVTWGGTVRAPLKDADVYPKTERGQTTWVGVGGTPKSVVRTAKYGLPLMLAIIGGQPERFAPFIDLYKESAAEFNTTAGPVGMHSPGFIADTDEEAKEVYWPHYKVVRDRIGAERGWPPVRREEFEAESRYGSMYIGSPDLPGELLAR